MNLVTVLSDFLWTINPAVWAIGNTILAYIFLVNLALVIFYAGFMNWRKYPVGKLLLQLYAALALLSGTSAYRVLFGATSWLVVPDGVQAWRPLLQTVIYAFIAITMTQIFLVMVNRWRTGGPLQVGVAPKPRERVQTGPNAVVRPGG